MESTSVLRLGLVSIFWRVNYWVGNPVSPLHLPLDSSVWYQTTANGEIRCVQTTAKWNSSKTETSNQIQRIKLRHCLDSYLHRRDLDATKICSRNIPIELWKRSECSKRPGSKCVKTFLVLQTLRVVSFCKRIWNVTFESSETSSCI